MPRRITTIYIPFSVVIALPIYVVQFTRNPVLQTALGLEGPNVCGGPTKVGSTFGDEAATESGCEVVLVAYCTILLTRV